MKRLRTFSVVLAMISGVSQAGTILYSDNFDDAVGSLNGQALSYRDTAVSTNLYWNNQTGSQVETDGVGVDGTAGAQVSTGGSAYVDLYNDADIVSAGYSQISLSVDVDMGTFTANATRADRGIWLGFMGATPNANGYTGLRGVTLQPDGGIWCGRKWDLNTTYKMGDVGALSSGYHNFAVDYDMVGSLITDVRVDGLSVFSSLTNTTVFTEFHNNASYAGTAGFSFNSNAGGQTGYLDNLSIVAIPEPATLGLIGVFGGGMLFIRRKFMM